MLAREPRERRDLRGRLPRCEAVRGHGPSGRLFRAVPLRLVGVAARRGGARAARRVARAPGCSRGLCPGRNRLRRRARDLPPFEDRRGASAVGRGDDCFQPRRAVPPDAEVDRELADLDRGGHRLRRNVRRETPVLDRRPLRALPRPRGNRPCVVAAEPRRRGCPLRERLEDRPDGWRVHGQDDARAGAGRAPRHGLGTRGRTRGRAREGGAARARGRGADRARTRRRRGRGVARGDPAREARRVFRPGPPVDRRLRASLLRPLPALDSSGSPPRGLEISTFSVSRISRGPRIRRATAAIGARKSMRSSRRLSPTPVRASPMLPAEEPSARRGPRLPWRSFSPRGREDRRARGGAARSSRAQRRRTPRSDSKNEPKRACAPRTRSRTPGIIQRIVCVYGRP